MDLQHLKAPTLAAFVIIGLSSAAFAQSTPTTPPAAPGTATTTTTPTATSSPALAGNTADTTRNNDRGFDWGWLGLIGLAGLAGLRRRDQPVVGTSSTLRN